MKKTLLATTALAFVAAHASAVDVELYGQVNKGLFAYDDGHDTNTVVQDNMLSSTRFGFKGAQALDNGLTASVLFETEMASNPSNGLTQAGTGFGNTGTASTPGSNTPTFAERQARVGLSGNFGGVYLGQQSTAIDGVLTQDLAGVSDVMSADYRKIGGAYQFRNKTTKALTGTTVNGLTSAVAVNREDSIRYDSPIFAGFQGRASVAQGGNTELAGFYDNAYGDFKVKGALGVQFVNSSTTGTNVADQNYAASVSLAHKSGVAGTLGYTAESLSRKTAGVDEGQGWYAKVGYAWDAFEVAADYGANEHFAHVATKNELNTYGLGAQYNLGNGVSVAGLYRNYDANVATDTDTVNLYGVNMRVKF